MKNMVAKKSKESGLAMQQLYGLFAMERLILKLSRSSYADQLVVKGGFLLTTELGVSYRATRDLDFTVRNSALSLDMLEGMINVIKQKDNSSEYFECNSINETRDNFEYNGYNIKFDYYNEDTKIPINVDFTTGEELVAIDEKKQFTSIFTHEKYALSSYSTEQIISDKFYTLLAYGAIDDTNSRMKDYYDLYLLTKINKGINFEKVMLGLDKTMKQRNNLIHSKDYNPIIDSLSQSGFQNDYWSIYTSDTPYAGKISFKEVMDQIKGLSNKLIDLESKKSEVTKERKPKLGNKLKNKHDGLEM